MSSDEQFMLRCLELASNGLGTVSPNPMVGCVIVHEGKIVGEGFHQRSGEAHAEVNAIRQAAEKHGDEILKKSSLYVSLEPCAHFGKTPPCADLIIEKKIPEVLVGCTDAFPGVNGKGIQKLKAGGVNVHLGILESQCREMNKRFFTFHEKKRPYIILKWAQSADQFMAPANQSEENRWISNEFSRRLTHKWRSEEDSVLVGKNTVLKDNPALTVRDWAGNNPVRIVLNCPADLPRNSRILDNSAPTLLFNGFQNLSEENLEWITLDFSGMNLQPVLEELYRRTIQSVVVEGGAFTLQKFIKQGFWDEARIFISDKFLNDGIKAPEIDFSKRRSTEKILNDTLHFLRNN